MQQRRPTRIIRLHQVLHGFYRCNSGLIVASSGSYEDKRARGVSHGFALPGELLYLDTDNDSIAAFHGATFTATADFSRVELYGFIRDSMQFSRSQAHDARARVRWFLGRVASSKLAVTHPHGSVVPLSREAISWAINLSREHAGDVIQRMVDAGKLSLHGKHPVFPHSKELRK